MSSARAALGAMKNVPVRVSADEGAKSVQDNWRAEHLFALKQALAAFDFVGTQLTECDAEIELQLQSLKVHDGVPAKGKNRGRARNAPKFAPAREVVPDVPRGFDAHRRHRRHYRVGGGLGSARTCPAFPPSSTSRPGSACVPERRSRAAR